MRLQYLALSIFLAMLAGCTKEEAPAPQSESGPLITSGSSGRVAQAPQLRITGTFSQPISKNLANAMIESYLSSINYDGTDNDFLRSLSFDADTMRRYLSNPDIVTIKFMLAHCPEYLNNGNTGVYAGTKAQALTLIVVGLDENANYVYTSEGNVYDHFRRCPDECDNSDALLH